REDRATHELIAIRSHSGHWTGRSLFVYYGGPSRRIAFGNRVSHRGSYRDALSLPGEEEDRQRHQDTFSLYRRHRIVNLHLHGPSSTRRPPRRIFLPTLLGRFSGHMTHTPLRSTRSSSSKT